MVKKSRPLTLHDGALMTNKQISAYDELLEGWEGLAASHTVIRVTNEDPYLKDHITVSFFDVSGNSMGDMNIWDNGKYDS